MGPHLNRIRTQYESSGAVDLEGAYNCAVIARTSACGDGGPAFAGDAGFSTAVPAAQRKQLTLEQEKRCFCHVFHNCSSLMEGVRGFAQRPAGKGGQN